MLVGSLLFMDVDASVSVCACECLCGSMWKMDILCYWFIDGLIGTWKIQNHIYMNLTRHKEHEHSNHKQLEIM